MTEVLAEIAFGTYGLRLGDTHLIFVYTNESID